MEILNLGILAHVDAGKTSLTEHILFESGVIKAPGRVDDGNTQTDTLAQERARGITIKSAVVSFDIGDLTVNLIDTPGHADFVAEVQRSLTVLDAVVLVISAVEGIQPQTRKLAKAVQSRGIPLIIFVNKIDRIGARFDPVLDDIKALLGLNILPFARPTALESDQADVIPIDRTNPAWHAALALQLAENSDEFMEHWLLSDGQPESARTQAELHRQVGVGALSPVFVGSATRGIGVRALLDGIAELIPEIPQDTTGPLEATVFKIDQSPTRERLVFARINRGTIQNRAVVQIATAGTDTPISERIKGVDRFRNGLCSPVQEASAGEIVRLHGLSTARIGDWLGTTESESRLAVEIAQPRLESVIAPIDPAQRNQLNLALQTIADADPLINLQQNDLSGELSVRLFGEIQQEVILETLATDFGVRARFGEPAAICIERPIGSGAFVMHMGEPGNPFVGTVGISLEAEPIGSGIQYQFEPGSLPPAYYRVIEEAVIATLAEGLFGWQVSDCMVTLTHVAYSSPVTTGTDFRRLTPMVVMQALERAGVQVCQPVEALEVVTPAEAVGDVMHLLITTGATLEDTVMEGEISRLSGTIPTINVHDVEKRIYGFGRGTTSLTTEFLRYEPVAGTPPARSRRTVSALHREEYIGAVSAGKVVMT